MFLKACSLFLAGICFSVVSEASSLWLSCHERYSYSYFTECLKTKPKDSSVCIADYFKRLYLNFDVVEENGESKVIIREIDTKKQCRMLPKDSPESKTCISENELHDYAPNVLRGKAGILDQTDENYIQFAWTGSNKLGVSEMPLYSGLIDVLELNWRMTFKYNAANPKNSLLEVFGYSATNAFLGNELLNIPVSCSIR